MKSIKITFLAVTFLVSLAGCTNPPTWHTDTFPLAPEDCLHAIDVGDPCLSPDGQQIPTEYEISQPPN